MPRQARIKPSDFETTYHLYNRIAGDPKELPFGDQEKEKFVELVLKLSKYYCVEVLAFCCMSNHWHLLVDAPAAPPSNEEAARRYTEYYEGERWLDPQGEFCTEIAQRLRDVSWFVRDLQQRFTTWYNHSCGRQRRGGLWAGRFKSCIIEKGLPLWECLKYIEMNAVRAGIVRDPADYRFCSWGAWNNSGEHPFAESLYRHVVPGLYWLPKITSIEDLQRELRIELTETVAREAGIVGKEYDELMAEACPFTSISATAAATGLTLQSSVARTSFVRL